VYRFWAMLLFVAVIVQVGAAGYGAFYAAHKVGEKPKKTLTDDQWDHGFGLHGFLGFLIFLATILLLLFALGSRFDRRRVLLALGAALLVLLQIVLAGVGGDVPAIGALHGLNALVIVGYTGYLAREAQRRTWTVAPS
jgi:hypothetical protein